MHGTHTVYARLVRAVACVQGEATSRSLGIRALRLRVRSNHDHAARGISRAASLHQIYGGAEGRRPFVHQAIEALCPTARELVVWAVVNGPTGEFVMTLTWDGPVLHIEVTDQGALVPGAQVSLADAELAVRLLQTPAIE